MAVARLVPEILAKLPTDSCVSWPGNGSRRLRIDGRLVRADRHVFSLVVGDPGDHDLDRTCQNDDTCMNPAHMRLATHRRRVLTRSVHVRAVLRLLPSTDCIEWPGQRNELGYGEISSKTVTHKAHRYIYIKLNGDPGPLDLDHLCRNTSCVNPAHLEPVTHAENVRRGTAAWTHCRKKLHEWTPENTVIRKNGTRLCRACRHDLERARYARDPGRRNRQRIKATQRSAA